MPLLKGKENIGTNVKTEEAAGKPRAQAVAIALREAGVPKAKDNQPMVTAPNSGTPMWGARADDEGCFSVSDCWAGRRS